MSLTTTLVTAAGVFVAGVFAGALFQRSEVVKLMNDKAVLQSDLRQISRATELKVKEADVLRSVIQQKQRARSATVRQVLATPRSGATPGDRALDLLRSYHGAAVGLREPAESGVPANPLPSRGEPASGAAGDFRLAPIGDAR